jgi:hypothetical protein
VNHSHTPRNAHPTDTPPVPWERRALAPRSFALRTRQLMLGAVLGMQSLVSVAATLQPPTLTVPQTSTDHYTVSWTGIAGAIEHTYQLQESAGQGWNNVGGPTHTVSRGFTKSTGGTYSYRVQECFTGGDGSGSTTCSTFSSSKSVTVYIQPKGKPTLSCDGCESPDADGSYTIRWTQPSGTITHYRLFHRKDSGAWQRLDLPASERSRNVSFQSSGNYSYQVDACNTLLNSNCSTDDSSVMTVAVSLAATPHVPSGTCRYPLIGHEEGGRAPFTQLASNSLTIQYHDQCRTETQVRVLGRTGLSGSYQQLTSHASQSGWRSFTWSSRSPGTAYCLRVETTGADGEVRSSQERCATTPASAGATCSAGPVLHQVQSGHKSLSALFEDRCVDANETRIRLWDWPLGASSGTELTARVAGNAHQNGSRSLVVSDLAPSRRYCMKVSMRSIAGVTQESALRCSSPPPGLGYGAARSRTVQDVGTITTQDLEGVQFVPNESRMWSISSRQEQDGVCRNIAVREADGKLLGYGSGCTGVRVPLIEGGVYHAYPIGGVSTPTVEATCRVEADGAAIVTQKLCGWSAAFVSGIVSGDVLQAVALPPNRFVPSPIAYPAALPPPIAVVSLTESGPNRTRTATANFVAQGVSVQPHPAVSESLVLTGFQRVPTSYGPSALRQPVRLLNNDYTRKDTDGDGLGDALESAIGTCASTQGSAGIVSCNAANGGVFDPRDTDGDGISDAEEVLGRAKPGWVSQGADLPLQYWGANPLQKDVFFEVAYSRKDPDDVVKLLTPEQMRAARSVMTLETVTDSVRRSAVAEDVRNPNGQPGIVLHFDAGRDATVADWTLYGKWGGFQIHDPIEAPDGSFSWKDKSDLGSSMAAERYGAFRHLTTFGWNAGSGQAGWQMSMDVGIASNDGAAHEAVRTGGVIAHELGHNLGFGHGSPYLIDAHLRPGYDPEPGGGRNCKPLWFSHMNYSLTNGGTDVRYHPGDRFSYNKRSMWPRQLVEQNAFDYYVPDSRPELRAQMLEHLVSRHRYMVDPMSGSIDWNRNGIFDEGTVAAGLHRIPEGGCEDGRLNRFGFDLGNGWANFEVPASIAAARDGNVNSFLYVDRMGDVRWISVDFDDNCASSGAGDCSLRVPASGNGSILFESSTGVDIEVVSSPSGAPALMAVSISSDGALQLAYRSSTARADCCAWRSAWSAQLPGGLDMSGVPELVTLRGEPAAATALVLVKDSTDALWIASVDVVSRSGAAEPDLVVGAFSAVTRADRQVRLSTRQTQPSALLAYPFELRPSENVASQPQKSLHLFVAAETISFPANVNYHIDVYRGPADAAGTVQLLPQRINMDRELAMGSKLEPVWVNAVPGDDRSGALYLFYAAGGVGYVRAYERGQVDGAGAFSSGWIAGNMGIIDPGSAWSSSFAAVVTATDVEPKLFVALATSKGNAADATGELVVHMRPRIEGVEHFPYEGYNDWLTMRYTLCEQIATGFGAVPSQARRVNCRPAPWADESSRID